MYQNIFIDANVVLDLFEDKRPFYKDSTYVLSQFIANPTYKLFISSDMVSNIFYILKNHYKYGFDNTLGVIEKIAEIFNVYGVTSDDVSSSIEICKQHIFKDYEDALQYICAINSDCSLIITNNPKDFKNSTIEIKTTKELYQEMKKE